MKMIKLHKINGEHLIFEESPNEAVIIAEQLLNIQVFDWEFVDDNESIYYVIKYGETEEDDFETYWTLNEHDGDEVLVYDNVENVCKKINELILDDVVKNYFDTKVGMQ